MANYYSYMSSHKENGREKFYKCTLLIKKQLSIGWSKINPINKTVAEIENGIEIFYKDSEAVKNIENAKKSLPLFAGLIPGDLVFIRGDAEILDVVIITGIPFFAEQGDLGDDYCFKVPFTPLFNQQPAFKTNKIKGKEFRKEVLSKEGVNLVMHKIEENFARKLLIKIFQNE
ncbi:MAG: hypothetical protein WCL14_01995 [Bacteroidota bacterium]